MRNALNSVRPETLIPSARVRRFIGKRRNRRLLVVSAALVFLALLGLIAFTERLPTSIGLPATLLLALLACAHGVLLNLGTQLVAAKRTQDLDERQLGLWRRAHHRAYRILVGVLALALVYVVVFGRTLGLPDTPQGWTVAVTALWIFVVTLPSSVVYWTEPDVLDGTSDIIGH